MIAPVSDEARSAEESALVSHQIDRQPREPWRIAIRCVWGRPSVIASPARLEDGSLFPTLFWLTCPWLLERVGALESGGAASRWAARAAADPELAGGLRAADAALAALRVEESAGEDACAGVGVAGQRDPLAVKCLHAHVALTLAGVADPIGSESLASVGSACADDVCARLLGRTEALCGVRPDGPAAEEVLT